MRARVLVRKPWFVILAFIVGVNLIAFILASLAPTPSGPPSSSYATSPEGLAAYAELLERDGRSVTRLRGSIADARSIPSNSTLVVVDPDEPGAVDSAALREFVQGGGRLIAGGNLASWTEPLLDGLTWTSDGVRDAGVLAPAPETTGVASVATAGAGSYASTGSALPIVGAERSTVVAVANVGEGTLVLLADTTWLQNTRLDAEDNAALALGIAGEPRRSVVFAESVHGYGEATGLAALPSSWKWALGLGVFAALIAIAARARRIGPPDEIDRDLPPPRVAYVDSVAGILARTGAPPQAVAPNGRKPQGKVRE